MSSYQGVESWIDFVSVGGVASVGISFIFTLLSKHQGSKARQLEGAFPVEKLDELSKLSTMMPVLVAVRGLVESDAPKQCELCDKKAVIHEIIEEEIWRKERENGRTVHEPFEIRKVVELCEWFLDDGTSRLRVENGQAAERLQSAMEVKQIFEPEDHSKSGSLVRLMIDKAWKMTKQGVRKTEHFLPVGATVTAVGEVSRNTLSEMQAGGKSKSTLLSGLGPTTLPSTSISTPSTAAAASASTSASTSPFVLRRPSNGPFYITSLTLQQLHASMFNTSKAYKYIAIGFGVLGAVLVTKKVVTKLIQLRRAATIRRRVAEAEAKRKQRLAEAAEAARLRGEDVTEDHDDDRTRDTCVVCIDRPIEMVFPVCGHFCCCYECGQKMKRCPVCRTSSTPIKVYRP
eukprot:gene8318-1593_t